MRLELNIHKLLLVAIILLQLIACNDDSSEEPNYIQFGELVLAGTSSLDDEDVGEEETRATIVEGVGTGNKNYQGEMILYGLVANTPNATTPYINGDVISVTGGQVTTSYQWPSDGKALTFYAFAAGTANVTNLTVTPQTNKAKPDCNIGAYNVLANQQDLLFGATGPFSGGIMQFEFQHVLSRITFQAKSSTTKTIVVTSITLTDVYNNLIGKVEVSSSNNKIAATTWDYPTSKTTGKFGTHIITVNKTIGTTAKYLPSNTTAGTNDNVFMFPHSSGQFASQTAKLTIAYTKNGTSKSKDFDLENNAAWGMGQWINYVITFKEGTVEPEIETQILGWDATTQDVDGCIGRRLTLSTTNINLVYKTPSTTKYRIYFWTDQKTVAVESMTTGSFNTPTITYNPQWSADGTHISIGYIDLVPTYNTVGTKTGSFTINADGLKKTVSFSLQRTN